MPRIRPLPALALIKGKARVAPLQNSQDYAENMVQQTQVQTGLFREVLECTKEIRQRSQELQVSIIGFATNLEALGKLSKDVECHNQANVFEWVSKVVKSSSQMIA